MVKYRNAFLVFLFSVITLGVYAIYWAVSTTLELKEKSDKAPNPWLLLLLLVPFVQIVAMIYYYWMYCTALEEATKGKASRVPYFLLLLILGAIGMAIVQLQLNKLAKK